MTGFVITVVLAVFLGIAAAYEHWVSEKPDKAGVLMWFIFVMLAVFLNVMFLMATEGVYLEVDGKVILVKIAKRPGESK